MNTPFDKPERWWERITFPTARDAYLMGHEAGVKDATPAPRPKEVVYTPETDSGFYVVEEKRDAFFGDMWMRVAVFRDAELTEAEDDADNRYRENAGRIPVRVVKSGKAETP